jgi:hypothetical protein
MSLNDTTIDQTEEETLAEEVSDAVLEVAAGALSPE